MEVDSIIFLVLLQAEREYKTFLPQEGDGNFEKARERCLLDIFETANRVLKTEEKYGISTRPEKINEKIMRLLNNGYLEMRGGKLYIGNRDAILDRLKSEPFIQFIFENGISAFSEDDLARMRATAK